MILRLVFLTLAVTACGCAGNGTTPPPGGLLEPQGVGGDTLFLPRGFRVNIFAAVAGARYLALGPGGAVYVSRQNAGSVVRLVDTDGDGVADLNAPVLSGLRGPFGIAFRGDTMYVAEETVVKRIIPGVAAPDTVVFGLPAGGHSTRTVVFGPDGKMYVSVGSSCNVCPDTNPLRAAVFQYNPDGTGRRVFATGLRNSVGLAFHPTTGELWATNNDRDNIGGQNTAVTDDLPPERINIIKDRAWYGWPQCYLPGERNPEYPAGTDCSNVEPPAITFQAHSAPLGIRFYTGTAFPADFRGDAFMAYHGSWNRSVPTGAKVVRVHVENGRPVAMDDFVVGWQLSGGSRWGRPVDVLPAADGSLLISDDQGGRIWRVAYEP